MPRETRMAAPVSFIRLLCGDSLQDIGARRYFSAQERLAVLSIAELHFKAHPFSVAQDGHSPRPFHSIRELPEDAIPLFVIGESFTIRLNYSPDRLVQPDHQGTDDGPTIFNVGSRKPL